MRQRILSRIARLAAEHPVWMFVAALVLTGIAAGLATQLKLTMQFKNLMPQDHPMVQEFNRIVDDYSTASMIIVAAQGEELELKQFADEVAPRISAMEQFIRRVDYRIERDFFLRHGFMLQKAKDLKDMQDLFTDLSLLPWLRHLNDNFEKEFVQDEDSLSTKEKENNAIRYLDGIQFWLGAMDQAVDQGESVPPQLMETAADRFLIGDEYMTSQDKHMLLLFAQPTFTVNELDKVVEAENAIDQLLSEVASKYPSLSAGTTGTMALSRDEMVASSQDMYFTSIIALVLILVLFVISFRMWVAPILAGITLVVGILWAAGIAALTVGSLNIMTSMFSVILIGLGVDFSIHIISIYGEARAAGHEVSESLQHALLKSGGGIITGALTTGCAFFTLMISRTKGMSEFGVVAGSGVLCCMLATLWVLPAMLSLRERIGQRFFPARYRTRSTEFRFLGHMSGYIARHPVLTTSVTLLITVFLLIAALGIRFDYNYLNMEPVGLTSIRLQHEMEKAFDVTPDFALVTASSVEEARHLSKEARELSMIGMVTSISDYVPSQAEQEERIPILRTIAENLQQADALTPISEAELDPLIEEFYRLEDNLIEFAQLAYLGGQQKVDRKCRQLTGDLEDPDRRSMIDTFVARIQQQRDRGISNLNRFHAGFAPHLRELALDMTSTEPISVATLPGEITDRFMNTRGDRYLVSIYPKEQVWNLRFLKRFTERMQELDPRVTGTPSVFFVLIQMIGQDGKRAAVAALIVIFLLLLWDFRSLRAALFAMIPLVVGGIWMIGLMRLFGLQLTMVNVMGLPLILGIGVDDGVHVLHRLRAEGRDQIESVFMSTGKAILLTSLTTMLAFGSLTFATYRGLGSLGMALFIGVAACFLATVLILPALLGSHWRIGRRHTTETLE